MAQNTTTISTQNLEQVGDKIVDVYKRPGNDWKLSYRWVTELVRAEFLTVLIALDSNVKATLSGKMPITYQGVPIARLALRNFTLTKGMSSVSYFHGPDATPLLSLFQVKDPITKKAFYTEYK